MPLLDRRECRQDDLEGRFGRGVRVAFEPVGDAGIEGSPVLVGHAGRSCEVIGGWSIRIERGPQLTDRVVKAGPRGPFRDAQGRRDLGERVPQVVVQHDDRPLFRCQQAEGVIEGIAIDDRLGDVWARWAGRRRAPGRGRSSAARRATRDSRLGRRSDATRHRTVRGLGGSRGRARRSGVPVASRPGPDGCHAGSGTPGRSNGRHDPWPGWRTPPGPPGLPVPRPRVARCRSPRECSPSGRVTEYGTARSRNVHLEIGRWVCATGVRQCQTIESTRGWSSVIAGANSSPVPRVMRTWWPWTGTTISRTL